MAIDHHTKTKMGINKILPVLGKKDKTKSQEVVALKTKEIRPEQVIPMEEGDFKEF